VLNVACSLGRPDQHQRRLREVTECCSRLGFELRVVTDPQITDLVGEAAESRLAAMTAAMCDELDADVICSPSPHDGHHGHEAVGRAAVRAAGLARRSPRLLFWQLWSDLPVPTLMAPLGKDRLETIVAALSAHAGELERNDYRRLVEHRARMNGVLGPERVFGFGSPSDGTEMAELTCLCGRDADGNWRLAQPARLDSDLMSIPLSGPPIAWWLEARSVRAGLREQSNQND
jgi:LmbE family N-acetylglucosaminyl deacetylase